MTRFAKISKKKNLEKFCPFWPSTFLTLRKNFKNFKNFKNILFAYFCESIHSEVEKAKKRFWIFFSFVKAVRLRKFFKNFKKIIFPDTWKKFQKFQKSQKIIIFYFCLLLFHMFVFIFSLPLLFHIICIIILLYELSPYHVGYMSLSLLRVYFSLLLLLC